MPVIRIQNMQNKQHCSSAVHWRTKRESCPSYFKTIELSVIFLLMRKADLVFAYKCLCLYSLLEFFLLKIAEGTVVPINQCSVYTLSLTFYSQAKERVTYRSAYFIILGFFFFFLSPLFWSQIPFFWTL